MGTLLLDVGGRDNLGGEVEPLTEVVKTLYLYSQILSLFSYISAFHGCFAMVVETYLGREDVVVVLP